MGRIPRRSAADWLRLIRAAAADSSHVRLTAHARQRMQQRAVTMREVLNVLRRGGFEEPPAPGVRPPGHWTARLGDRSGVAVVIGLDPEGCPVVLDVVTVMRGQRSVVRKRSDAS